MKWVFWIGILIVCVASFFAGMVVEQHSGKEEVDLSEIACDDAGGVLARARSGYVCVVPINKAI